VRRFEFPLQRVADWREKQLTLEEVKLERLNAEVKILDARRAALDTQQAASDRGVLRTSTIASEELHRLHDFRRYAKNQRALIAGQRAQAEGRIEEQRTRLLEARRNLELLKRLRSKKLAAWSLEFSRELEQNAAEAHLSRMHMAFEEGLHSFPE
jgi:flagellar biosynthesis chaperone FliJ